MGNITSTLSGRTRQVTPERQSRSNDLMIFSSPNLDYEQPDYVDHEAEQDQPPDVDFDMFIESSILDEVGNMGSMADNGQLAPEEAMDSTAQTSNDIANEVAESEEGEYESDSSDSVEFILDRENPEMTASTTLFPYVAKRHTSFNARFGVRGRGMGRGRGRGRGGNTFNTPTATRNVSTHAARATAQQNVALERYGNERTATIDQSSGLANESGLLVESSTVACATRELFPDKINGSTGNNSSKLKPIRTNEPRTTTMNSTRPPPNENIYHGELSDEYSEGGEPSPPKRRGSKRRGDDIPNKMARTATRTQPGPTESEYAEPTWEDDEIIIDPNDILSTDDEDDLPERVTDYTKTPNLASRLAAMLGMPKTASVARSREQAQSASQRGLGRELEYGSDRIGAPRASYASIAGSTPRPAGHGTSRPPPARNPNFDLHMPSLDESSMDIDPEILARLPRIRKKPQEPSSAVPASAPPRPQSNPGFGTPVPEFPGLPFNNDPDPWGDNATSHGKKKKKRKTGDTTQYSVVDSTVLEQMPKKRDTTPGIIPLEETPVVRGRGARRSARAPAQGTDVNELSDTVSPAAGRGRGRGRAPAGPRVPLLPKTAAQKRADKRAAEVNMAAEREAADRRREDAHARRTRAGRGHGRTLDYGEEEYTARTTWG